MLGDHMSLIDAACPYAAHIEFLERDDLRMGFGDDFGNAGGIVPAVAAAAAMDIVGQHAKRATA